MEGKVGIFGQPLSMPPLCQRVRRITLTLFDRLAKNFYRDRTHTATRPV